MALRARSLDIRGFLLRQVYFGKRNLIALAVKEYGMSRQAVHGHLAALLAQGELEAHGRTRGRRYSLARLHHHEYELANRGLQEDRVWSDKVARHFEGLPKNVRDIWQYGFTEMLNNAIEHSGSENLLVRVERTAISHSVIINDYGVGIFRKLSAAFGLGHERDAFIELMKGKVTTDPERHSGQGIFFCSRMFDKFLIASRGLLFSHDTIVAGDRLLGFETDHPGTAVLLELADDAPQTARSVFDKYSSQDGDYAFITTDFPVKKLQEAGEPLTSRSQARRLMARLEKFRRIEFDFDGVEEIGQAFADEIFRVFARAHPAIEIVPLRAKRRVMQMINRARSVE